MNTEIRNLLHYFPITVEFSLIDHQVQLSGESLTFHNSLPPMCAVVYNWLIVINEDFGCKFGLELVPLMVFKDRKELCSCLSSTWLQVKNVTACGSTNSNQ